MLIVDEVGGGTAAACCWGAGPAVSSDVGATLAEALRAIIAEAPLKSTLGGCTPRSGSSGPGDILHLGFLVMYMAW
jgi:hypothetical protein